MAMDQCELFEAVIDIIIISLKELNKLCTKQFFYPLELFKNLPFNLISFLK